MIERERSVAKTGAGEGAISIKNRKEEIKNKIYVDN